MGEAHFVFSHNKMEPLLTPSPPSPPSPPHSLRQEEIAALSGPDEFAEFYRRLKQVRTLDLLWFFFLLLPSPLLPSPSLLPLSLPLPPPSQLKDYRYRYPSDVEEPMQMEFLKLDKERENPDLHHTYLYTHTYLPTVTDMVDFTDEEGYGKYLDLHQCYDCYINLKELEVSQSECYSVL